MKKYGLLLSIVILWCQPLHAQMLDMSGLVSSLQLSDTFINRLEKCEPYQESKTAELMSIKMDMSYDIKGWQNEQCVIDMDSKITDIKFHSNQHCSFTPEILSQLIPAMREMTKTKKYTLENLSEIISSEAYQTATGIMMNEEICQIRRDAIDMTKELRKKLENCEPYTEAQHVGPVTLTRSIRGMEDGKCSFSMHVLLQKPDLSQLSGKMVDTMEKAMKDVADSHYDINCRFDSAELREYISILNAQVIPEASGAEAVHGAIKGGNPRAENEFLARKCETVMPQ